MSEDRPRRVLLVEDQALIALDVQDLLEDAGYAVVGPADGVALALALAQQGGFDAALLDINLFGEKVWPVAEYLRDRDIPFAFLSGSVREATLKTDFAHAPLLDKPIDPAALRKTLARLLA